MLRALMTTLLALGLLFPTIVSASDLTNPLEPMYEIVVELERDQDPEIYGKVFLAALDVPAEQYTQRLNHRYEVAIVGFSVFLTSYELDKATRMLADGQALGIKSITQSATFSLPVITEPNGEMPTLQIEKGAQVIPSGIQRVQANSDGAYNTVDVAVIDTGVDALHPDLNVVGGIDCTAIYGEEGDYGHDGYGHGTHVAGTIAALDNDIGVVGVAPGARIHSVKVLDDSGSGTTASVLCGIEWVAQNAVTIDVANMSLGGFGMKTACDGPDPMHNGICVASEKTVFVVAAGNSSADAVGASPANYDEVITVSAYTDFDGQPGGAGIAPQNLCYGMSKDDSLAAFSNYGVDVDIAAPGVCILSTLPGELNGDGGYTANYGYASGTSMASPHVAGAVARFLASNPDQREFAREQVLTWSDANGETVRGDLDNVQEPLLFVGGEIPRYEGTGISF